MNWNTFAATLSDEVLHNAYLAFLQENRQRLFNKIKDMPCPLESEQTPHKFCNIKLYRQRTGCKLSTANAVIEFYTKVSTG